MKIKVTPDNKEWTDFEKQEWAEVDIEHYGQRLAWTKKIFVIEAVEEEEIVGSSRIEIEVGVAYINTIIVKKDQRRKGIGKLLLDEAERIARENGAHKIYLQTGKEWDVVRFYEKAGYKTTADLPNHFFHHDFIEMTKFLDA